MTERSFVGIRGRTFETQQAAIAEGYASTVEWAIDHLAARVIALEQRLDTLDGAEEIVVEPFDAQACGAWDEHRSSVCVLVPGHTDPHSFRRVNG